MSYFEAFGSFMFEGVKPISPNEYGRRLLFRSKSLSVWYSESYKMSVQAQDIASVNRGSRSADKSSYYTYSSSLRIMPKSACSVLSFNFHT